MVPSGLELAGWAKLERLGNAHDFAHAVEQFEVAMIEVAMNADGPSTVCDSPVDGER